MNTACSACSCPTYLPGPPGRDQCARPSCRHPMIFHRSGEPGLLTSVIRPISVRNTGNIVLEFVGNNRSFTLAPGEKKPLAPGDYDVRVETRSPVDPTNPVREPIVIAVIVYNRQHLKFDIQAENGVEGASFESVVDLRAVTLLVGRGAGGAAENEDVEDEARVEAEA